MEQPIDQPIETTTFFLQFEGITRKVLKRVVNVRQHMVNILAETFKDELSKLLVSNGDLNKARFFIEDKEFHVKYEITNDNYNSDIYNGAQVEARLEAVSQSQHQGKLDQSTTVLLTPPTMVKKRPYRSTAKQVSFKKKLMRVRRGPRCCEICQSTKVKMLEAAHFIDLCREQFLILELEKDTQDLPASINDAANGLILCPTCHKGFDKCLIVLGDDGTIHYENDPLHMTKVFWSDKIGQQHYPTAKLIALARKVKKLKVKRSRNLVKEYEDEQHEDDEDEDDDDDDEEEESNEPQHKKVKTSSSSSSSSS